MRGWYDDGWHGMHSGSGVGGVMVALMVLQVLVLAGVLVVLISDRHRRG